jgi:hypothetical protein
MGGFGRNDYPSPWYMTGSDTRYLTTVAMLKIGR